jgi:lysylphosphatidylglycerol synthetase-like protein (DUF2156 family)
VASRWGRDVSAATATSTRVRGLRAYPALAGRLGATVVALGLLLAVLEDRVANHNLLAVGLAAAALGRGIALRRPATMQHLAAAVTLLVVAHFASGRGDSGFAQVAIVLAGVTALWPPPAPAPGTTAERGHIWSLVNATVNDCLAPFAMRRDKSYLFSPDGLAAVAYRVRFGVAVASGDPLGAVESQPAAVQGFIDMVDANGWRLGLLGTGEEWTEWWKRQHGLRALPIGRDVVIDVDSFTTEGRTFRNLRQAIQRTRNAGVTTAIYVAETIPADVAAQLRAIVTGSRRNPNRGFSMILDGLLDDPPHPGTLIAVASDRDAQVVAFHRFSTADHGREITQDLPWRRRGAPNGVDERLTFDMVTWAQEHDARRVSLSFAAFPELYATTPQGAIERVSYWATHRLDRFIRLESLYRYLRKFHALGRRRYVVLRLRDLLPVAAAMLTFEFGTRRRSSRRSNRWRSATGARPIS